ncbi:MAG: hypothetical protein LW832_05890 [Parachlamydia sp.]|nr:hypothetical protein [Parachlamydia sp.]
MSNMTSIGQEVTGHKEIRLSADYVQWLTVRQFCSAFPWPSESGLRALIYGAFIGKNSFKPAFRKVGRRVLVSPSRLFATIDELNACPSSGPNDPSKLERGGRK